MALKKVFCGSASLRIGSLILLCIFLVRYVWSLYSLFIVDLSESYENFLFGTSIHDDNLILVEIFIPTCGAVICVGAIISIISRTPCAIDLFLWFIIFLILSVIYKIFTMFKFDVLQDLYDAEVAEVRNLYGSQTEEPFPTVRSLVVFFILLIKDIVFPFYAISVFQGYRVEQNNEKKYCQFV